MPEADPCLRQTGALGGKLSSARRSRDLWKAFLLKRHNGLLKNKTKSFTNKNRGIWGLGYKEEFVNRKEAIIREKQLKSYRGREFTQDNKRK